MYSTITVIEIELSSMTFVVPFDGSGLSKAALVRATEFGTAFDENVIAVTVIPKENTTYARDCGWIESGQRFDLESILGHLKESVLEVSQSTEFRYALVGRYAPPGTVANRIRRLASDTGATMVFVGSDNAGRMVTSLGSVGGNVASDDTYDVVIVRTETSLTDDDRDRFGSGANERASFGSN